MKKLMISAVLFVAAMSFSTTAKAQSVTTASKTPSTIVTPKDKAEKDKPNTKSSANKHSSKSNSCCNKAKSKRPARPNSNPQQKKTDARQSSSASTATTSWEAEVK